MYSYRSNVMTESRKYPRPSSLTHMPSRLFQVRTLALAAVVTGFAGMVGAALLLFALFPIGVLDVGPIQPL